MPSNVISLESIQIASPCRADWNAMQKVQGRDCIRFCPSCGKNVYDLSGFTRDEAHRLIESKEGILCLRLHRRSDGTVITSDCPVGKSASHKRGQLAWLGAAIAGVGTTLLALCGARLYHRSPLASKHSPTRLAKNPLPLQKPSRTEDAIRNMSFEVIIEPTPTSSPVQVDPFPDLHPSGVSSPEGVTMGSVPMPELTSTPERG